MASPPPALTAARSASRRRAAPPLPNFTKKRLNSAARTKARWGRAGSGRTPMRAGISGAGPFRVRRPLLGAVAHMKADLVGARHFLEPGDAGQAQPLVQL